MKAFLTFLVAYLVATPCYYAGYMYEAAVRAFAKGRAALRQDVGIKW